MAVHSSILELIGNTRCSTSARSAPTRACASWRSSRQNPAGSVKDRAALRMVEEAEADARSPREEDHRAVLGNTGIVLSMIARIKGY